MKTSHSCSEAHCLSQWSFNFRPTFLRIKKELEVIRPLAVLALTATAPRHVQHDIMEHLSIQPEGEGGGESDSHCVCSIVLIS
jgi:superfamily II DNA helicase RecQ